MFEGQHTSVAVAETAYATDSAPVGSARQRERKVVGVPTPARKRFDIIYERKLARVLDHSQADSCVALVDLATGDHLQRVKSRSGLAALNGSELLRLTRALWQPDALTETERTNLLQFVANSGGVKGITLPLENADLFVNRLAGSSRALILLVRHRARNNVKQDTLPRARLIQTKLTRSSIRDAASTNVVAELDRAQRKYSHSIWHTLFQSLSRSLSTTFGGNINPARAGKLSSGLLDKVIHDDDLVVFAELIDLTQDKVLQQYRGRDTSLSVPDAGRSILALHNFFEGELDLASIVAVCGFPATQYGKALLQLGDRDYFSLRIPMFPELHTPFAPNGVLMLYKKSRMNPSLDWIALDRAGLDLLRMRIGSAPISRLKTTMLPFPETRIEFQQIVDDLRQLPHDDLIGRLDIGGFARNRSRSMTSHGYPE